jgi:hypothetical protein
MVKRNQLMWRQQARPKPPHSACHATVLEWAFFGAELWTDTEENLSIMVCN